MDPVVLVVDDNPQIREVVKATLVRKYTVLEAENGDEAEELCKQSAPSLVLLDIHLAAGSSGFAVCARLLESLTPAPLIVFLTGDPSPEVAERCSKAGGTEVLHKPFSPLELLRRIGALLESDATPS